MDTDNLADLVGALVDIVIFILILVTVAVPVRRILRRTGLSGWWCLLAFVPLANLIGLWLFAHARWPACDGPAEPDRPTA